MILNWRIPLLAACLLALSCTGAHAQPRKRPPSRTYAPIGLPDQAEGRRILEAARQIGFGDSFFLEIELRLLPRRGAETRLHGRWLGLTTASGPITRLELQAPETPPEIWLIHGNTAASTWRRAPDGTAQPITDRATPIANSQIGITDLQTPFLHWDDFTYEGMLRFRGRPTHVFLLYPPDAQAASFPEVAGVRAYIDTEYDALSQVQWVDESGSPLKTITAGTVRKVPGTERWIVTSIDVRDERSRDKTRLLITGAALDLPLDSELFNPAQPLTPADLEVPAERMRRFE